MLFFGDQLAVILTTIFGRGALGVLTKETAKVVAVGKSAACGDIFNFEVIAFQQLARVFQTGLRQLFIEPDVPGLLKKVREIVRGNIKCPGNGIPGQRRGMVFVNKATNSFE